MRIAFIAMSGVRVQDSTLLSEGLTLPGFVERSEVIANLPSLGLLTLAGMTPQEKHERIYLDLENVRDKGSLPLDVDLVAISTFTAQIPEAYDLADYYRDNGVKVAMGGMHVSVLPDEALQHCDAVCIGSGESVWPQILADTEAGVLKQRYQGETPFEFREPVMPAFELLDHERYNRITIQTSRGCSHRCEFCAGSVLLTDKYEQKSIADVLAEIDRINELWTHPFIELADDNSFLNAGYWRELLPEMARRKLRWFTEADIAVGEDPELLDLLYQSGCKELLIGLESPNNQGLDNLELRSNWKLKRRHSYRQNVIRIQEAGIRVNACFVIGLDGHDDSIFDAVYDFAHDTCVYDVQVTLPTPFPGTPFHKRLKKESRLFEDKGWDHYTLFDLLFEPQNFTVAGLQTKFRALVQRLYSKEFTDYRRHAFKKLLRKKTR